ncbi:MAG: YfhO family protein [Desulfobacteraceae bacterium]|nr:YfhO family protein [Desulfobacteraceae bacterium]
MQKYTVFFKNIPKKAYNYEYIFAALVLNILFFYPLIFSDNTLFFRDIHGLFYPMKYFLAKTLKTGSIPFWCPNFLCGSPFMSDIQAGVFYPVSIIFLIFPFPFSFNIYIIAHFFLAFCFFYLFIRQIGLSRESALFTSISFCFGGYAIASVNTINNLSTLAWLPAITWSFLRAKKQKGIKGYFLTVVFLCMSILGGEPQLFIMSMGILTACAITYVPEKNKFTHTTIKNLVIILILVISALLITVVQLGPTFYDYQHSARAGGISYEQATRFSVNYATLKHLILPLRFPADFASDPGSMRNFFPGDGRIPWLLTIYPGFLILPLAILGLFAGFSKKVMVWLALFLISLFFALGNNTPVYFMFYKIFPFFRFPVKFMFPAGFSLLVIAGYGLDRLILYARQKSVRTVYLFSLMCLILIADLDACHRNLNLMCDTSFYKYRHPAVQPILDDPGIFRVFRDPAAYAPGIAPNTIINKHLQWQLTMVPHVGILHNINHAGGSIGLELMYQYFITETLSRPWNEKINFLRMANVKYIISSQNLDQIPEIKYQVEKVSLLVYKIKNHLPRAWIVGQLNPATGNSAYNILEKFHNPGTSAFTNGEIVGKYNTPFFKEADSVTYENNNKIHIELTCETPGVLVLAESFYPVWEVFVDGAEKKRLNLNFFFQGVEIEKGTHNIDFIYSPKHFSVFCSVSLISLAVFFLSWLYCKLKQ